MPDSAPEAPKVRVIPPLVFLAGLAIGLAVTVWVPTTIVPTAIARLIGEILLLCGAILAGSALFNFRRAGTTVRPDRAATTLVIKGPYRFTRNPMYLGLAAAYLGVTVAAQSLWALILLPVVLAVIQRKVIRREEAFLAGRFGSDYRDYQARVRRWL